MKKSVKYSPEVMERAVRLVFEARAQHESQWATVVSIAAKMIDIERVWQANRQVYGADSVALYAEDG